MTEAIARPPTSALLWTALMTLPLLMPGARRRYGTIPVALAVVGLGRQVLSWMESRRRGPAHELKAAVHDPDVAASPHLRSHFE